MKQIEELLPRLETRIEIIKFLSKFTISDSIEILEETLVDIKKYSGVVTVTNEVVKESKSEEVFDVPLAQMKQKKKYQLALKKLNHQNQHIGRIQEILTLLRSYPMTSKEIVQSLTGELNPDPILRNRIWTAISRLTKKNQIRKNQKTNKYYLLVNN